MVPPDERAKLYVQVPGCWKKYEPYWALLVRTSALFAYASRFLLEELLAWKALYRAALIDHCVIVVMVLLQRVHPGSDIIKLNILGFDLRMRECV